MRKWVKDFRPVRQRTVRGETTKDKSGMLPPAVYANTGANFTIKHLQLIDSQDNQPEELEDMIIDENDLEEEVLEESDQESEYASSDGDDVDDNFDEQLNEPDDQQNDYEREKTGIIYQTETSGRYQDHVVFE